MNRQGLTAMPRILHAGRLANVDNLFDHIELTQAIETLGLVGEPAEIGAVFVMDIFDMSDPVVGETDTHIFQGCSHATTAIVPHHNDVLDLELINRELNDGECVEICVHDNVGDISVYEHFSGGESRDLVGGDARVRATDPKVLG